MIRLNTDIQSMNDDIVLEDYNIFSFLFIRDK